MRTALQTTAVAALLLVAGCGAGPTGPAGDATTAEPTPAPSTTVPTTDDSPLTTTRPDWKGVEYDPEGSSPDPPDSLAAEATHLYDRLSNDAELREYGVAGYTVSPGGSVLRRNDTAAVVRARLGYSSQCGATIADDVSEATYRVSTDEVVRLDGPTVDPVC